jgi:hypothetical protein
MPHLPQLLDIPYLNKLFDIKEEPYNVLECDRFMRKFKRAIVELNYALSIKKNELYAEIDSLLRLGKIPKHLNVSETKDYVVHHAMF